MFPLPRTLATTAAAAALALTGTGAAAAQGSTTGAITESGVVSTGPTHAYAELSGITRAGGQTLVVNDKTEANNVGTAVMSLPGDVTDGAVARPLTELPDLNVQKLG